MEPPSRVTVFAFPHPLAAARIVTQNQIAEVSIRAGQCMLISSRQGPKSKFSPEARFAVRAASLDGYSSSQLCEEQDELSQAEKTFIW